MHKIVLVLTLIATLSFSKVADNDKFQILSNKLNSKDNIVIATGNVVIFSPKYYISAQKVIYDKTKGTLELFDDVVVLKNNITQTQSDYAFLDLNDESITQNPILVLEKKSNVWITSNDARKKANKYNFENSILSSCDCIDPAWNIRFSSADYDTEDQWLNTYNTRLYIKNFPILYTPYLGFSTDDRRRTGLLIPTIGYSSAEGFLYSQPIYIAPKDNYDIEFIPQIRSNRGYGMYAYYRLIDSQYSKLNIKTGYFKEKSSYANSNSLTHTSHYGWSVDYIRTKLISDNNSEDGLYASVNWLNDIEFYNLEDKNYASSSEQKVESKINYYYKNSDYYLGTYLRHYIDTSKISNKDTIQQIPQVQLHSFSNSMFFDELLYSTDLQVTNYTRETGLNAVKTDLVVPISYSFLFFDDYLRLKLQEEISVSTIDYSNSSTSYKNAQFIESRHTIGVNSDLLKKYETGIHTINLSSDFIIPETTKVSGDIYPLTSSDTTLTPFPISKTTKVLTFAINQSWTSLEDLKEIINHKLKQSIIYDSLNNSRLGDLENEIRYNYYLGTISNKLLYSNIDKKIVESSTAFSLNYLDYYLNLSYYMSRNTPNSGKENLESYAIGTGIKFYKNYKFSYVENYNIKTNTRSKQAFVFEINDRCWNLNINFEKSIVPSSTTTNSRKQDIIYVQLLLKPLGGIRQQYNVGSSN